MRGPATTSTRWTGPSPSSKVATVHQIVGWIYLAIALLLAIPIALDFQKSLAAPRYVIWFAIVAVLAAAHLMVYRGALTQQPWARAGSLALGILLFFIFPIFGWVLGVYVIFNSAKPWGLKSALP